MAIDSKRRFSNRVEDYAQFRPGYPPEAIRWILSQLPDGIAITAADIGAGTGIFTESLLLAGLPVVAVEPNPQMREKADKHLGRFATYSSTCASAEETGLACHSIDLITAAQAFHWFDVAKSQQEFKRILKPGGRIVLIWNRRDASSSEFLKQYELLLRTRIPEYSQVSHENASDTVIEAFLGPDVLKRQFKNHQWFDLHSLKGRLLSSSYCPAKGRPGHDALMAAIEALYEAHSTNQGVRFDYSTQVYMATQ